MIKFFRRIRYKLMREKKTGKPTWPVGRYIKYALGEIALIMVGILLALQVSNWNEGRKDAKKEQFILENLKANIHIDKARIEVSINNLQNHISNFEYCLEILARNPDFDEHEFTSKFRLILYVINFELTTTTFDNIISTGKIDLIENEVLVDSIVSYYNFDYKLWDSALKDYTRNIIAPFLHKFDHVPYVRSDSRKVDISKFDMKPKTVDDYRKEVFIINILRSKLWLLEGQKQLYEDLRNIMENLVAQIDIDIESL